MREIACFHSAVNRFILSECEFNFWSEVFLGKKMCFLDADEGGQIGIEEWGEAERAVSLKGREVPRDGRDWGS